MKLTREFLFDAAHNLAQYGAGHPNARVHGHSFRARITLSGAPDANGQIMDFESFGAVLENLRKRLDHNMLNDIEGLGTPTLENLCLWMWAALQDELPHISAIEVFRDSLGQSCLYEGEAS
ncbi:MAG: 6-carboxytetrahydropterin synthase [Pseudomonadota bacterium]|nr:6-carboxytetrahydropterin synthase [Pseudomonadota bacterium]MEC7234986.1 6-carboxytetrahydropterin synthase [Pseudomonadota bacterium]